MLPPISAALSASVDYQTAGRPIQRPPVTSASGQTAPAVPMPPNLLNGGRIDVLSLFSQLNIAQGLSVFAETVGSYLKISRREGESLIDYAQRLAEAVKSLSASQRAMLEQTLAQLVRGMTLRTLTEVLSNLLGPEAARVSAYLEAAQLTERDPVARAVVSSYRLNGGAEVALAPPTSRLPAVAAGAAPHRPAAPDNLLTAGAPVGGGSPGDIGMIGPPRPAGAVPPQSAQVQAGTDRTAGVPESSSSGTSRPQGALLTGLRDTFLGKQAEDVASSRASLSAGTAANTTSGDGAEADAINPPRSEKGPLAERAGRGEPMPATTPGAGAPVIYDGPALARVAQRATGDPNHKFLQEVLYQTASTPLSSPTETPASGRQGSQAAPSLVTPTPEPDATPPSLRPDLAEAANRPAGLATAGTTEPDQLALQTAGSPPKVVASPLLAQALPDPSTLILAAPMVAREGFAQAFVAYPHVPPPPPEEERDVERVTAVDEDGGGRPSQQDAQREPDTEEDENSSDEGDAGDGRDDHAEDLYWRMADLT